VRAHWTRRMRVRTINVGQSLRLIVAEPSVVHWGIDDWQQPRDTFTVAGMLDLQVADLASEMLKPGQRLVFSIQDLTTGNWIESNCMIGVVAKDTTAQGMLAPSLGHNIDREAAD